MEKPEAERPPRLLRSGRCGQGGAALRTVGSVSKFGWWVGELRGTKGRMKSPFQGQGGLVERRKGRASWAASWGNVG